MKNSVAVIVGASIGLSVPATAADMTRPMYTKAPMHVQALPDWAGFYVGAHVGYAWGDERDNLSQVVIGALADKFSVNGVIGGVHAGYNWQAGRTVFGIEGDFDASDIKGSQAFDTFFSVFESKGTLAFKSNWQGSLRARLGYAGDSWLLYATGGIAFANVDANLNIATLNITACEGICVFTPAASSDDKTLVGWTVGLGAEHAWTRNWITRAEVRYTSFEHKTFTFVDNFNNVLPTQIKFHQVTASFGVSYKF